MKKSLIVSGIIALGIYSVINLDKIICRVKGHKWKYVTPYKRYCVRCDQEQRLVGYDLINGPKWKTRHV